MHLHFLDTSGAVGKSFGISTGDSSSIAREERRSTRETCTRGEGWTQCAGRWHAYNATENMGGGIPK